MADSGADPVAPLNLAFTATEFNLFLDKLSTGKYEPDVVPSSPSQEKPGGEAETSSTTNLKSAYLNLPHLLKSCLDYCYFVLRDYRYCEKYRLGWLLLAEGLIKQDNSSILKEDAASAVIDELIGLGMLEKDYFSFETVRIPSSYHKLAIWRTDLKNLFANAPDSPIRIFIEERRLDDLYPNLCGLSITSLFDLRFRHNKCKPWAYMEAIWKLKSLVVLDLKGDIECLPDEIGELVHLKYLCLTYYKRIGIPDMADTFIQKIFEMVFCNLDQLPVEVLDIQRLWHLMMNTKSFNSKAGVPMNIGLRLNLHTLTNIYARGGVMSELGKFTQLRRLGIDCVSDEHANELCAATMSMTYLISPSMAGESGRFALFPELEAFSPPPQLQKLKLRGRLADMPTWVLSMENLSNLTLSFTCIHDESIFQLQFLPNLKYLHLRNASMTNQIGKEFCQAGGFPKLEMLLLKIFSGLRDGS